VKVVFMKKFFERKTKQIISPLGYEQRAQSEAVFRLMIDSVVGLAVLVIILSAISYFNDQEKLNSISAFRSVIISATSSPDGTIISSQKALTFAQGGSFAAIDLQEWTNVSENCFTFDSSLTSTKVSNSGKRIEFLQGLQIKAHARCITDYGCDILDKEGCCMQCIITFGKEPEMP